jgi:hypothetical protein
VTRVGLLLLLVLVPFRAAAVLPIVAARVAAVNVAVTGAATHAAVVHGAAARAHGAAAFLHTLPIVPGYGLTGAMAIRGFHVGGSSLLLAGAAGAESQVALAGVTVAAVAHGVALFPSAFTRVGATGAIVHGAAVAARSATAAPHHLAAAGVGLHITGAFAGATIVAAAATTASAAAIGLHLAATGTEAVAAHLAVGAAAVSRLLPPPVL